MKPKPVNVEDERMADLAGRQRQACDQIIERAATMMVDEVKAPIGMVLDRILTYAAAQACTMDGSLATAAAFREFADKIEAGLFHSITGENAPRGKGH